MEENAKKIIQNQTQTEEEEEIRRKKAVEEFQAKLDEQEKRKIEKAKKRKAELIKAYLDEIERKKLEDEKKKEEIKWETANRLKNDEVNKEFYMLQMQDRKAKANKIRSVLDEQVREKKLRNIEEKKLRNTCNANQIAKEEDQYFMNYANQLIRNAHTKNRPVYPILHTIEQYKKRNNIGTEKVQPPHLKSNVPINKQECHYKPTLKPIIKYDINELKQLNPYNSSNPPILWA